MAVYPCDYSPHRYPDAQQSVYVTSITGNDVETRSLRLCPRHFQIVHELVASKMALVDEDSTVDDVCASCGGDKVMMLSAKVFPAKQEMEQWAVDACATCAEVLLAGLRYASGRLLSSV